jgi:two-component system response regulator VanR
MLLAGTLHLKPVDDWLRVDARLHEVWIGERRLEPRLSPQEFHVLAYLAANSDRVCTHDELGDALWGAGNWVSNMLHRVVHRLKAKLESDPRQPRYVRTVPQIGYRLTP